MNRNTAEFSITPQQLNAICRKFELAVDLQINEITLGSSSVVYSLGGKYILKIDPSGASKSSLAKEVKIYEILPRSWPCPKVIGLDESKELINYPYLIMSQLNGSPVDLIWENLSQEQQSGVSQQMGDLLGQIHTLSSKSLLACFPKRPFAGHETFEQDFQARASSALKALEGSALLDPDTLSRLQKYFRKTTTDHAIDKEVSLLHGSYNFRNILCEHNAITGIIDWEDAQLGNPSEELALVLFRFFPGQLGDIFLSAYTKHLALPSQFADHQLRYPLLYYLRFLPDIASWMKYPGRQIYFREMTQRVIEEALDHK